MSVVMKTWAQDTSFHFKAWKASKGHKTHWEMHFFLLQQYMEYAGEGQRGERSGERRGRGRRRRGKEGKRERRLCTDCSITVTLKFLVIPVSQK